MPQNILALKNRAKALRLIAIANDLLAIARDLELSADLHVEESALFVAERNAKAKAVQILDLPIWAELARQLYRDRRNRNEVFGTDDLFGEPAWDILLDLFVAAKERRRVSVSSACIGAAVPSTTALRWITILEMEGLIQREPDPNDARRVHVALTPVGYSKMLEYFAKASFPIYPVDREEETG